MFLYQYDENNPFDNPPSDEEIEPELVELQTEGFADYVRQLDVEQNERLQEEEHEIVRLWEARNTVLSQLESPVDDNLSTSEVESHFDENQSIVSQRTDYPKVKISIIFIRTTFILSSSYPRMIQKVRVLRFPHV